MRCRSVLTRLDALRTGELPAGEQGLVHEHLETCRSCDASVSDVDTLAQSVKSALTLVPPRSCRDAISDSYELIQDVWVAFSEAGLKMILRGGTFDELNAAYAKRYCRGLQPGTLPDALRKQVLSALEGAGVDKPRVD